MSEEQSVIVQRDTRPRGMPGLTWAVILIAVGVVFLVNNLHINGFSIDWLALIRFWPVILILLGLDILLGRHSVLGSLAVAALAVVTIGGLVWLVGFTRSSTVLNNTVTREVTQELGDVKTATVDFSLGAGDTHVASATGSGNLVSGTYTTSRNLKLNVDYQTSGDNGTLRIRQENVDQNVDVFNNFVGQLDLKLTDAVPLAIVVDAGVGNVTLDLSGIKLQSLSIKGGVGNVSITLPAHGDYTVSADVGVGQLSIRTPHSLEASVSADGGISNTSLPSRFQAGGKSHWQTAGFDGASDRATITVDTGIGNFEVIDQ